MLIVIVLIAVALAAAYLYPAYTKQITDSQGKLLPGSISSLEKVTLGNAEQWILIRGDNTGNPVLLFLHGGPGTSELGLLRKYNMPALEKHFIVVAWDQRGAGKSFASIIPESGMTVEQIISDTIELSDLLCKRFNKQKIYLAGHSWGSALGILSVCRKPELYTAFIGIGQVVNMVEGERTSYRWTLEQAVMNNNKAAVKKLNDMGEPPYSGDWRTKTVSQRQLLGKFGGEVYGSSTGGFFIALGSLFRSEYNWNDRINFFRGIFNSMRLLWPQIMKINLEEQVSEIKVPVYFLLGRHDYEAPSVLAEKYYSILKAPSRQLVWFENSAHFINSEEAEKFNDFFIDLKRKTEEKVNASEAIS